MIDYKALLAYPIPEARQRVSKRDVAFYAISVGLGQDPLDTRPLAFCDPVSPGLQTLPFMAAIMAPHGFWLGNPDTGVDAVRLVHGEQQLRLYAPLPVEGELIGRSRVVEVIDKGAGKGALLYLEKELVEAASGRLIASLQGTIFLRGDGGFGGPSGPVKPAHALPETPPDWSIDLATRPEQAILYRFNGDYNPLHFDPAVSSKAGYPQPILHGLCTLGICGHAILRQLCGYDAARLRALALRFSAPVIPGDIVTVDIWRDGSFRARVKARDVVVINNGKAEVA